VQERAFWRTVLQLNLVRSVNAILEALQAAFDDDPVPSTDKHHLLRLRLRPLRGVESDLKRLLGVRSEDTPELSPQTSSELSPRMSSRFYNWRNFDAASSQDVTEVITSCKNDIIALWTDPLIGEMLRRYNVRLEDSASLFVSFSFLFTLISLHIMQFSRQRRASRHSWF